MQQVNPNDDRASRSREITSFMFFVPFSPISVIFKMADKRLTLERKTINTLLTEGTLSYATSQSK